MKRLFTALLPVALVIFIGACQLTSTPGASGSGATRTPPSPTATPTATPIPAGSIAGKLSYPAEQLPPLSIYAVDIANSAHFYSVTTAANQFTYTIPNVGPGTYHVIAYTQGSSALSGGYTKAVPCGLAYTCTDHTLIDVTVHAGENVTGIDPGDWYAPSGTFPPHP